MRMLFISKMIVFLAFIIPNNSDIIPTYYINGYHF